MSVKHFQRTELGGGRYELIYFLHDGRPVPEQYANHGLRIEFDASGQEVSRSLIHLDPHEALPWSFEPDPDAAVPPDESGMLALAEALGRIRRRPHERSITDGPPLTTQAV